MDREPDAAQVEAIHGLFTRGAVLDREAFGRYDRRVLAGEVARTLEDMIAAN